MRWWWLCLASMVGMVGAWSLALPVNGVYDEQQHLVWAYAVAAGDLTPAGTVADPLGRPTAAFAVPHSLLPTGTSVDCTWWKPPKAASCQHWTSDRTRVLTPTRAVGYSPVFYAAVGLPLLVWPDRTGIVLARLVSTMVAALLLAGALWLALRTRRRLLVAAVVLAVTPTLLSLAGAVNANGVEIAAGVLVGTALAALLNGGDDGRVDRVAVWLLAVGSVLLSTIRELGPVWLVLVYGAAAVVAGRTRVARLLGSRTVRRVLGSAWAVGIGFAGWWLLHVGVPGDTSPYRPPRLSASQVVTQVVVQRIPSFLKQMVAKFSYGEFDVSPVVVVAWYLAIGLLVAVAVRRASGRVRCAVAGLGVACLAVLIALDVHFLPTFGWFSQGRYAMPAAVSVPLLASVAGRPDDRTGRLAVTVAWAAVPLQLYTLAAVMTRFESGIGAPLDPFTGSWQPPLGRLLPLVALLAGSLVLAVTVTASVRQAEPPEVPALPATRELDPVATR